MNSHAPQRLFHAFARLTTSTRFKVAGFGGRSFIQQLLSLLLIYALLLQAIPRVAIAAQPEPPAPAPVSTGGADSAKSILALSSFFTKATGVVESLFAPEPVNSTPVPIPTPTPANGIAIVRHAPSLNGNGRVEGSLRQLTGESVILNGGAVITNDLQVPGTPTLLLNGTPTFGGTIQGTGSAQPTNYQVTLNGTSTTVLGHLVNRTNPITLTNVAAPPASSGTRSVTITAAGQSVGNFATLRDLTLNGNVGLYSVPAGTYRNFIANAGSGFILGVSGATQAAVYNLNSLTLNGSAQFQVIGPIVLTLGNGLTVNASMGASSNPAWLNLQIASGGLTLNSGSLLNAVIKAPASTVIINASSQLVGTLTCDRLTINGGGLLRLTESALPPVNQAPLVNSGGNQTITLPSVASLNGSASDDGLPAGSTLTTAWSKISGPGTVSFGSASSVVTTATFGQAGTYVVRLTASDSQLSNFSDATITVLPQNFPPSVSAGPDRTITQPASATLSGSASDDGLPAGSSLSLLWTKVSGPGTVTFTSPTAAVTNASFSAPGSYTLRLTASDSQLSNFDEVNVTANPQNQAPNVNAGADQNITLPSSAILHGTVTDDGLPTGSSVGVSWSKLSGPGSVTFTSPNNVNTNASFSVAGDYTLQLTASDTALSNHDEVIVHVAPQNHAPTVDAGTNQTITLPATANLNGSVSDDGLPAGSTVTTTWSKVSGPGSVAFGNPNVTVTTATFSTAGNYVLRLTASDSDLSGQADVTITVIAQNQAPTADAGTDQTITLPNTASLNGSASDDGLPADSTLTTTWTMVSGPGAVSFGNPAVTVTTASFDTPGVYVLRLSATDSLLTASDDVTVTVLANESCVQVHAGLVGWWPGDGSAIDLITNHQAQLNGGATFASGFVNQGFKLDGINDSVEIPDSPQLKPANITVETWVKFDDLNSEGINAPPGFQYVVFKKNTRSTNFEGVSLIKVRQNGVDILLFVITSAAGQQVVALSHTNVVVGQFYHVAGTYDGSKVKVYVNGVLEGETAASFPLDYGNRPIFLGSTGELNWDGRLKGVVDETSIFNRALNASEIASIYQAGQHGKCPLPNTAPTVSAGPDLITSVGLGTLLSGTFSDDGLPAGSTITTSWTVVSGPGTVIFSDSQQPTTSATFSAQGTYVLRLTASDSLLTASDDVTVIVTQIPPVADFTVPQSAGLVHLLITSFSSYNVDCCASYHPQRLLDDAPNTFWQSEEGQTANQSITFRPEPADSVLIDRVRLQNYGNGQGDVRDFEVQVSNNTENNSDFVTVLSGTLQSAPGNQVQEFVFAGGPVPMRYVRLIAKTRMDDSNFMRLSTFDVYAVGTADGIVSLLGQADAARDGSPALIKNGGAVYGFSYTGSPVTPDSMLDYSYGGWATNGIAGQYAIIQLAGGRVYTLNGVKLATWFDFGSGFQTGVRDFEVWVSATTPDESAFSKVLTATLAFSGDVQSFPFPGGPVQARYVKYVPLNNHGGNQFSINTESFDVIAEGVSGVVGFSSEYGGMNIAEAAFDDDGNSYWFSEPGKAFDQWVKVVLGGGGLRKVYGVVINPANSLFFRQGPRDFEIRVSTTTADDNAFTTVYTGTLPSTIGPQEIVFNNFVEARYVEFFWKNGHVTDFIGVSNLQVLAAPEQGAALIAASSTSADYQSAHHALDIDTTSSPWVTADGQVTDQWLKVLLPNADLWTIDHVALQPGLIFSGGFPDTGRFPKDFEIQVSTTDANDSSFTTVFAGTLQRTTDLQHFHFTPVQARYIKLLLKNNYGSNGISLSAFYAYTPGQGSTEARFADKSTDADGHIVSWSWTFGDGGTSTEQSPLHHYAAPGDYPVTLTVTDNSGLTSSHQLLYHAVKPLTADFAFSPVVPHEGGEDVRFTDTTQILLQPNGLRIWDFGDGSVPGSYNSRTAFHTFADSGLFNARLKVGDDKGYSYSTTKQIQVLNVPPSVVVEPGKTIVWGEQWTNAPQIWDPGSVDRQSLAGVWSFGDGQTSQCPNCTSASSVITHSYDHPGVYNATFTVTDKDAGVGAATAVYVVNKRPTTFVFQNPPAQATGAPLVLHAQLLDTYGNQPLAGKPIQLSLNGASFNATTDSSGVAEVSVPMPAGTKVDIIIGSFAGDEYYAGCSGVTVPTTAGGTPPSGTPSNQGTNFWLMFPYNYFDGFGLAKQTLFITSTVDTTGTVTIPGFGFTQSFTVQANTVATVSLPFVQVFESDIVQSKGINVTSAQPVTVYGLNQRTFSSDAYLGLPVDTLGTDYFVLTYSNMGFAPSSQFGVVATENGTTVTITPATIAGTHAAGVPYDIVLEQGQTYLIQNTVPTAAGDLSGSHITTNKPLAVFAGHIAATIPAEAICCADHLVEQLPPTNVWGKRFATLPLATRTKGDFFRFVAAEDGTAIYLNGALTATLNRGQFTERILKDPAEIIATKPIMLAQYSTSVVYDPPATGQADPFYMVIPPYSQFLNHYTISTPGTGFAINYANVIAPTASLGSITLDGAAIPAAGFVPIGVSGFSGTQIPLSVGVHNFDGPASFGVFVYGYAQDEGYGYPGGMNMTATVQSTNVAIAPETSSHAPNTEGCVVATATDQHQTPLGGMTLTFTVTGANPAASSTVTDAAGRATLCYVGTNLGTDQIVATVGSAQASASIVWTPPNQAPVVNAGADQIVTLPAAAILQGSATDDGEPANTLNFSWSKVSGPGNVTFGDAAAAATSAAFDLAGVYVLRLTATDTALSSSDDLTITVNGNQPPSVSAGPDQTIFLPDRNVGFFLNNLAGFNNAAGNPSVVVDFDTLAPGTDITGTTLSGIKFDLGGAQIQSAPLIVTRASDTFTPNSFSGLIDPATNKLPATSGANVLSPGGPELGPGFNALLENDDLRITFAQPVSAVGFDLLFQELDFFSAVRVTFLDVNGNVLYANGNLPDGSSQGGGAPGGSVFVGFVSTRANIATIIIDEFDDNSEFPDANIGFDSFRVQRLIPATAIVNLSGIVNDDGLPPNSTVSSLWSKVSGPGSVTFDDPAQRVTKASFSEAGTYMLQLTASDSQLSGTDDVVITVNEGAVNFPPTVNAGNDQTITLPTNSVNLSGSATDDGKPVGSTLVTTWSVIGGPGSVTFANAASLSTTATFAAAGTYVLRLTANDSQLNATDELVVTVNAVVTNQPPQVNAGADQSISLPAAANLQGSASDDGLPAGALTVSWSRVSGPGSVTFGNPNATVTAATFGATGVYVLRLTASDTVLSTHDDVQITVAEFNLPPTANAGPDQTVALNANQVANGGSEDPAVNGEIPGWTEVQGTTWTRASANSGSGFPAAQRGSAYFYSGNTAQAELRQDVDLSAYATAIAAGTQQFELQAYLRSAAETLPDSGQVVVEYRDATNTSVIAEINSGSITSTTGWHMTEDLRVPPAGTGWLRIRLIATRNPGAASDAGNDAFFDSISLRPIGAAAVKLNGTVNDDGLPSGSSLTATWNTVSGPGPVTFTNSNAAVSSATFTTAGTYVLRLTAGDGQASTSDDVTVIVNAANQPPVVSAGASQTITLPATAALNGVVTDDGQPSGSSVSASWTKVSGPGVVTFTNPNQPITTAIFSAGGTYVLRLTADDTEYDASSEVTITVNQGSGPVNQPPSVNPGPNQTISLPTDTVTLNGTVTDDGLPAGSTLTITWTKVSGAGVVTFGNPNSAVTTAQFGAVGSYVLRLSASDGAFLVSAEVAVNLTPAAPQNQPPTVNAGPDKTALLSQGAQLDGSAGDDGLPVGGNLTTQWTKVSGPGNVSFLNPNVTITGANFSVIGTYVLRLTASDTALTASDDVTITVIEDVPPPTVQFTAPADDDSVTEPTIVTGSVSDGSWVLEYSLASDDNSANRVWTTFGSGSGATTGQLGTLDPTMMMNGLFTLRLSTTDSYGQTSRTSITVIVERNLKVGNFSMSFSDLNIPVAGVPMEVTRTYDSRDKRVGDFGFGWTLGLKSIRVEKAGVIGLRWYETVSQEVFPNYCLEALGSHAVTVTFPGGKVFKFKPTVTPGCQRFAPVTGGTLSFAPLPGTVGKLEVVGSAEVQIDGSVPGPVNLIGFGGGVDIFNSFIFKFTAEDGKAYVIDQRSGLQSIADPNGNTLTIGAGGIVHSSGKSIVFNRDVAGRISSITDPNGNSQTYTYNTNGDLVSYKDAENNTSTYTYDTSHRLLTIDDPRGIQPIRNDYDADGRLISHTDAFGKVITFIHNLAGRVETIADRLNHVTTFEYDERGNVLRKTDARGGVTSFTYDSNDNVLSDTNALGKTTTYTYDINDHRTSITDPLGNLTQFTYSASGKMLTTTDPLGRVTTNTYNSAGDVLTTEDPLHNITTFTYSVFDGQMTSQTDALSNLTRYSYNGNYLTKETDPLTHEKTYTYDANGNRASQSVKRTNALGQLEVVTTSYEYDKLNRLTKTTFADGSFSLVEYNSIGQPGAAIDQLGRRTEFTYDDMGRLARTTHPDNTFEETTYDAEGHRLTSTDRAGHVTSYTYDELGRLIKTTFVDGTFTSASYDAVGRVLTRTDARGNVTSYTYDAAGRTTKTRNALNQETTFTYDANGNQLSMTDALTHPTTYEYDLNNRRTKTIYADSTFSSVGYDALGQSVSKTDQAGKTTRFIYDPLGRLTKVKDALNQETTYAYDEVGQQISHTDANNHTTQFEYDQLGRRLKRILPAGQFETYAYDNGGNLSSRTDFNGKTTTFAYDTMHRLLSKTPDGSLNQPGITFTYNANGQRATMNDASGATVYTYDARNRLSSKQTPFGSLSYMYDDAGSLSTTRSSNANGASVDYSYDSLNRLSTVKDNNLVAINGGVTNYTYDTVGNLQSYQYPNGVTTGYAYNSLNRLTTMTVGTQMSSLAGYSYALGAAGNRTAVTELGGRMVSYTYDDLYRLTNESITNDLHGVNGSITNGYDAVGNRLNLTSTVSAVPSQSSSFDANNQLTSDNYDNNGNTILSNGSDYAYDFENHLTSANGGSVTYVYDGDGNRVQKTVAGVTTQYLVDTNNPSGHAQVLDEIVGNQVVRSYTYGNSLIAQRQLIGNVWLPSFYGYDGQTSVRFLTNASGAVTDTYTYDAFGNLLATTGNTPNEHLYTSERYDPNIGFYNLRSRYMRPQLGRFLTMDSFEGDDTDPVSLHKYLYVNANPVNLIDPEGYLSSPAIGMAVHSYLLRDFVSRGLTGLRAGNIGITTILRMRGVIPPNLRVRFAGYLLRPDLIELGVDPGTGLRSVYEIKPITSRTEGYLQVMLYLGLLNAYDPGWGPGSSVNYSPPSSFMLLGLNITVFPADQGVILYDTDLVQKLIGLALITALATVTLNLMAGFAVVRARGPLLAY